MTKIYVLLFFILLVDNYLVRAQSLAKEYSFDKEIVYSYSYFPDSTKRESARKHLMSLLLNKDCSLFQRYEKYGSDSVIRGKLDKGERAFVRSLASIQPIPSVNYQIFKFQKEIITKESIDGNQVKFSNRFCLYTEDPFTFNWRITEDTLRINNIFCQKACLTFGGRNWVAWFAPDIPIFEGPYKFQGLPGLIIKIEDEQQYFSFELISIEDVAKKIHTDLRNDEVLENISKQAFYEKRRFLRENMYSIAVSAGYKPSEELKQQVAVFMKEDNNHIEKY